MESTLHKKVLLKKTVYTFLTLSDFFIFFFYSGWILGEGVQDDDDEKMVEGIKSDLNVGISPRPGIEPGSGNDLDVLKRPESATSGEISSLNAQSLEANVGLDQQSPARSPHARSWTVPGV